MTHKTIIMGLVAIAFTVGSITTGTMAYAAPNGQPFQELWDAIDELESLVINLSVGWESIQNIPDDIADGDDNTQLTEEEVDVFVANNGFSIGEHTVDTDTQYSAGNGLQLSGTTFSIDESQVQNRILAGCTEGQYIQEIEPDGNVICGTDTADDADSNPANELQTLSIDGSDLTISGGNTVTIPTGGSSVVCEAPEFASGWINYGKEYEELKVCKNSDGLVTFSGLIRGSGQGHLFTVSEDFAPEDRLVFSANNHAKQVRVDVLHDGRVYLQMPIDHGWMSVSGITYYTTP